MGTAATSEELDAAFWAGNVRTANVLNAAILAINAGYFVLTWSTRPNRPALLLLTLAGGAGLAFGQVAWKGGTAAERQKRVAAFHAWSVAGVGFIVAGAHLDGGLSSPLVWLFPLGTLFAALVHPPALVRSQAAATLAGWLTIAALHDGFTERPAAVGLHIAYVVAVGFVGERGAAARWALHDELTAMADRDPLTGLANHRVFHERLRAELAAAARSGEPAAVLLVDLDRFKQTNDEHGHLVGDAALQAVAGVLAGVCREADVAARVGGEEFALVLRAADAAGAAAVAERIRVEVAAIRVPVPVTVSVGVAAFPADATDAEGLFTAADRAMYRAKSEGRNRVCA